MERIDLPVSVAAGPTKAPVRSILLDGLGLTPADHFVEVGTGTGAVTIEAARRAGRVTTYEQSEQKARAARDNLQANGIPLGSESGPQSHSPVELRVTAAPTGLPAGDVLFLGGSRQYEAVLDRAIALGIPRIGMAVSRLEVGGEAVTAFRERDLLTEVFRIQVDTGCELAGMTRFEAGNPVYLLFGTHPSAAKPTHQQVVHPDSAAGQFDTMATGGERR